MEIPVFSSTFSSAFFLPASVALSTASSAVDSTFFFTFCSTFFLAFLRMPPICAWAGTPTENANAMNAESAMILFFFIYHGTSPLPPIKGNAVSEARAFGLSIQCLILYAFFRSLPDRQKNAQIRSHNVGFRNNLGGCISGRRQSLWL